MFERGCERVISDVFTQCWNFTATPLCPHVASLCAFPSMGGPEEQWTPNLGRISATLCPLSNAHYIFLSESFYVYFMIDCLHLFWAARSSREEHAKWLIYDCGFLCLTSASTQTHLTGNQFYLLVKPRISFIQTHNMELFIYFQVRLRCPISYTRGALSLCPVWFFSAYTLKSIRNDLYETLCII